MTDATKEPILFKRILEEFVLNVDGPILMHSENKSVIERSTGDKPPGKRAKHVDVSVHCIRELIENNGFAVPYVATDDDKSDGFTKPLGN
jgi:hypothetical protein